MDNIDKFFQESHYNIMRILLSMIGVWPFQSVKKRYAIYFGFLLLLTPGITFQVMGMIDVWPDVYEVLDCIPTLILSIVYVFKAIFLIYSLPKVKYVMIEMVKYWYSPKSDNETKILHSYAINGRKLSYAYTVFMFVETVILALAYLLGKFIHVGPEEEFENSTKTVGAQTGLPYRVNYMVDLDTYFVPIYIHTTMCVATYILILVVCDIMLAIFVQHCCGLLVAVRYILENAFEFAEEIDSLMKKVPKQSKTYSVVVYSIRRHSEVIQFIDMIESLYTIPLFLNMGTVITFISIIEFQLISYTRDMSGLFQYLLYFSGAVLTAFIQNWQGQKIIDYSEKVYEYAYSVQWYDMSNATRKLSLLMMLRSMKPSQITAGKLIVMSYENFNAQFAIDHKMTSFVCTSQALDSLYTKEKIELLQLNGLTQI